MRWFLAAAISAVVSGPAMAGDLTLKRVILSSGGVGYFEYAAAVDGDEFLGLDVPLGQVDDILKSLVVFDPSGGVAGVELPGRDNIAQAFGDAPFGPEALASPAAYLNALRGTEVAVQGNRPMTGRILRAEAVTETVGAIGVQRTRVTLLGADGMRQFVLEDSDHVQVADPALRGRIERALEALRRESNLATRHLTIRVKGKGKRAVSVGYVAGAPLWKATYRLVLGAPGGGAGGAPTGATARLQGWATLENQSGADWKNVALTLQYGNPVTFRQSLYRSYFVQRPEVPVEILGKILPSIDTRTRGIAAPPPPPAPAPMAPPMPGGAMTSARAMAGPAPVVTMAPPADIAQADETAEETMFTLNQPVDLPAGHTANVPILDQAVAAPRIGLVPEGQTHPLAAVRVRNDSGQSLPAGVLTLYDSAAGAIGFAGDARLGGLPAGESRILSFAQDLRTSVEVDESSGPEKIVAFTIADGVLRYTARARQIYRVTATAPAKEPRDLLVEIARANPGQTLTLDDGKTGPAEQTATAFRLAISLAAGATKTVTAWVDRPLDQVVALMDGDQAVLRIIANEDKLNAPGRAALNRVLELRQELARRQAEAARQTKLLQDVQEDEERIRKNLAAVTSADPLRARLTRALDADETKIEQLRKTIDDAAAEVDKAHRALAAAVTALRL